MTVWQMLGLIMVAGGIGGLVNSLIQDKSLILPQAVSRGDGVSMFLPGFIGNMLIGSVSAAVSWLLYSPFTQEPLLSTNITLTLTSLGGAVLVGMAGSGWLSNAMEKNILRIVASQVAAAPQSPGVAKQLLEVSSVEALKLTHRMENPQQSDEAVTVQATAKRQTGPSSM